MKMCLHRPPRFHPLHRPKRVFPVILNRHYLPNQTLNSPLPSLYPPPHLHPQQHPYHYPPPHLNWFLLALPSLLMKRLLCYAKMLMRLPESTKQRLLLPWLLCLPVLLPDLKQGHQLLFDRSEREQHQLMMSVLLNQPKHHQVLILSLQLVYLRPLQCLQILLTPSHQRQ